MTDLDAALDDMLDDPETTGHDRCKLGLILDAVTDTQRAKIVARLAPGQSLDRLSVALRRGGQPVSRFTLYAHRRRLCLCYDTTGKATA